MDNWNKDNKTILTLQMGDTKATWETVAPCNDVPAEDLVHAFYAEMVAFTYLPSTVLQVMREFVDDKQKYVDPDYKEEDDYDNYEDVTVEKVDDDDDKSLG